MTQFEFYEALKNVVKNISLVKKKKKRRRSDKERPSHDNDI